ncbi:hypothetical protein J7547_00010 [Wohlfahrtiimonas chitiniclastica]|uniref:Uncharacterized protein n=1 Tax=Wohlfahrtiimonas chitiniclastica TaxID=400946 RepID=A0AB35BV51_9GAMM|nr:hypothetical protein [Wohlfahrtiimonas chitiniclastica]MBS7823586.1 hypothetical protein [Wohlfahrtiimonas chitiniclastica]MBS7839204.1 hypothetical protein [Wohlfahrtiimonas chitiniclastica]
MLKRIILIICLLNIVNGESIMNDENQIPILENKIFKLTNEEYLNKKNVKNQIDISKEKFKDVVVFELSFELVKDSINNNFDDTLTNNSFNYKPNDLSENFIDPIFDIKLDIYFKDKMVDSFFITEDIVFLNGKKGVALEKKKELMMKTKK